MQLSVTMIINIVLIVGLVLSYLIYKHYANRNANDPEYQKRREESLREERRQMEDNGQLDEYLQENESEYRDEET